MKDAIIIDIDNCWLDSRPWIKRAPFSSKKEEDWNKFYKLVYLCKANKPFIRDAMSLIEDMNLYPIFITSRSDRVMISTKFQIENNSSLIVGETCNLYMRTNEHKYAKSGDVKNNILKNLKGMYNFLYAIDDTPENLIVFKEYGVRTVVQYFIETHDYEKF